MRVFKIVSDSLAASDALLDSTFRVSIIWVIFVKHRTNDLWHSLYFALKTD